MKRLPSKSKQMRHAIDMMEGALMAWDDLHLKHDLWKSQDSSTAEIIVWIKPDQLKRVMKSLSELTRIINSEEFSPKRLK